MKRYRYRIAALITMLSLTHSIIASPIISARIESAPANTDWSKAVVDSTIKRFPTADSLKGWGYAKALYLYGVYLVYLRTKDKRYLDHIQSWIDLHIDDKGKINRAIFNLSERAQVADAERKQEVAAGFEALNRRIDRLRPGTVGHDRDWVSSRPSARSARRPWRRSPLPWCSRGTQRSGGY